LISTPCCVKPPMASPRMVLPAAALPIINPVTPTPAPLPSSTTSNVRAAIAAGRSPAAKSATNPASASVSGAALALTYVSLFEGFGVPVLEALHGDVPVLTSNVSSLPEVAGDAGLLVNPLEVEAIASAMQQLYGNAALREKLIATGNIQRQKFSWERAAEIVWEHLCNL